MSASYHRVVDNGFWEHLALLVIFIAVSAVANGWVGIITFPFTIAVVAGAYFATHDYDRQYVQAATPAGPPPAPPAAAVAAPPAAAVATPPAAAEATQPAAEAAPAETTPTAVVEAAGTDEDDAGPAAGEETARPEK
jgi:hypothetical protein